MLLRRSFIAQATVLLGVSPLAHGQTGNTIVLGQSAPFTGPAAQLGIQFYEGAKLFFDAQNAKGGVAGRKIELKFLDDGYEPARTAENTKKFITDGVFALFGYIGTPTSVVALPLATEAKVPFFAPFTGAQALREPFNRYAIHIRASYFDETAAIVRQATSMGAKKVAVFYQNDAYGKAGLEGVDRALKALNLGIVATGTVERNSIDVQKAVANIMVKEPECIVQISAYKSCAEFIRQARKAGFGGTFYNVSFVGTQALAADLGEAARGVAVSQVMPFPFNATTPLSNEFLKAVQAVAANNPALSVNYSSMEGFVAAKVFVEALRRAGARPNTESFLAGLESMQNLNMGGFAVDFSPQKHTASKYVDLTMLSADGKVRH